jgi:hypothetical protein
MSRLNKKTVALFLLSIFFRSSFIFAGTDEGGPKKINVAKSSKGKLFEPKAPIAPVAPKRANFYRINQNEKSKISIEYKVELAFQSFFQLIQRKINSKSDMLSPRK